MNYLKHYIFKWKWVNVLVKCENLIFVMKYCIFPSPYSFQYKNIANNFWLNYQRIEA